MEILGWVGFFLLSWGLPFTAYFALQIYVAVRLKGRGRLLALTPAIPMVIVLIMTIKAYREESNLWPCLMILAGPIGVITLLSIWFSHRTKGTTPAS
jgi:hypothetical protein